MKESDEFLVLQKYFKNLGSQYNDSSGIIVGPGDDSGLFLANKSDLIFSTDVSNVDIHFPKTLAPDEIAYRACCVAASDIPACGGTLKWLSIGLVTPSKELAWLKDFARGLKLFTKESFGSPAITAVEPENIDAENIRKAIKNDFDILLAGGQDHLKGKIFRIGHLGFVNDRDILSVISALESTLDKMGKLKAPIGRGIAKTISVLNND